jgi:nucleoside-diphosphate-sugar epimerase
MQSVVVCGAGGFIGQHLVARRRRDGAHVRGVDLKYPRFSDTAANDFLIGDLRDPAFVREAIDAPFDEVYQLAAEMGGAGYVFVGRNDAEIMHNSAQINLNVVSQCAAAGVGRVFFSSSACVYPTRNQLDPDKPNCEECSVYPAEPDSEYGWEKLFSERLYQTFARTRNLSVRIARYHNVFGPLCDWVGGREKAPAAVCRKVAEAPDGGSIEIWGDGRQTRSFLHVDECVEATLRLMRSDVAVPLNVGSEEMISIDGLARMVMAIAGKRLSIVHRPGPQGVRGRRSDNRLIRAQLGWEPSLPLAEGMARTYRWIEAEAKAAIGAAAQ